MNCLVDFEAHDCAILGCFVAEGGMVSRVSEDGAASADKAGEGGQIWPMVTYDLAVLVADEDKRGD